MFGFVAGDVGDCGEDMSAVCRRTFDAVAVINSAIARFLVDVKLHTPAASEYMVTTL